MRKPSIIHLSSNWVNNNPCLEYVAIWNTVKMQFEKWITKTPRIMTEINRNIWAHKLDGFLIEFGSMNIHLNMILFRKCAPTDDVFRVGIWNSWCGLCIRIVYSMHAQKRKIGEGIERQTESQKDGERERKKKRA